MSPCRDLVSRTSLPCVRANSEITYSASANSKEQSPSSIAIAVAIYGYFSDGAISETGAKLRISLSYEVFDTLRFVFWHINAIRETERQSGEA